MKAQAHIGETGRSQTGQNKAGEVRTSEDGGVPVCEGDYSMPVQNTERLCGDATMPGERKASSEHAALRITCCSEART